ncbi:MAG: hypothetical protein K1X67_10630 [Fimbriimonadaceae bacterium]|nr:hypothetical protein [Fimbriimonadaceae bacterium]
MAEPSMTPEEREAIRLYWAHHHPGEELPPDQIPIVLKIIRARVAAIEEDVAKMAVRAMSEGRKTPRRHSFGALAGLATIAGVVVVGYSVYEILARLFGW